MEHDGGAVSTVEQSWENREDRFGFGHFDFTMLCGTCNWRCCRRKALLLTSYVSAVVEALGVDGMR